jgi:hypothetical protein
MHLQPHQKLLERWIYVASLPICDKSQTRRPIAVAHFAIDDVGDYIASRRLADRDNALVTTNECEQMIVWNSHGFYQRPIAW